MALAKKSDVATAKSVASNTPGPAAAAAPLSGQADLRRRQARRSARQQKIAERVATASEVIASGITEAASAAEELRRSMQQIASGAQQASGASQESLAAISSVASRLAQARERAEASRRRTEVVQTLLGDIAAQVEIAIAGVTTGAERQAASVTIATQLEREAATVGDIVRTVAQIAEQTNLLALNAAIEAARAGGHGRGFAVVADEIRALAERAEASARGIQDIVAEVQREVHAIAALITTAAETASREVEKGRLALESLDTIRRGMGDLAQSSRIVLSGAQEAERAILEAQRGAEQIAAAAEEQGAASMQSLQAIEQQSQALEQSQAAAQELVGLTEELRTGEGGDAIRSAERVAAAAEELSSAVQELSSAAAQIMASLGQIERGAQQQSAAVQQSSSAVEQIERGARAGQESAQAALQRAVEMESVLAETRSAVEGLLAGVGTALADTRRGLDSAAALERLGRRIERIVDSIETISVQTSMLAVSGSVEAARAGDSGRGFAVVSGNIRNLARDSSENTDRIKDLVRAIQDRIAAVRRDLEHVATSAEAEVQRGRALPATLLRARDEVDSVRSANEEIGTGAAAITASLEEVAQGAQQIASAAEQAARASSEAATAARQQARGAEDLAAAVEEIASLADALQNAEA